jgi:hypothetical protein
MMTNIGIFVATLFLLIFIPFSVMWYDHTGFVQEMVREDIVEYQKDVPDWVDLQDSDPAQLVRHATVAIIDISRVHRGNWSRDEMYEYRDSLYEVIAAGLHNPSDLNETLQVASRKYDVWISTNTYFVEHRLYAMRYTF